MGLAERRALQEFETNRFPALKQQVIEAAKFDVPIDVKWETLALDNQAHLYDESWAKVYFTPLIEALTSITRDTLGQEALRSSLKQIVIQNTSGVYYGDRWANFREGILTLDHEPTTNTDNVQERADGLVKVLEKAL